MMTMGKYTLILLAFAIILPGRNNVFALKCLECKSEHTGPTPCSNPTQEENLKFTECPSPDYVCAHIKLVLEKIMQYKRECQETTPTIKSQVNTCVDDEQEVINPTNLEDKKKAPRTSCYCNKDYCLDDGKTFVKTTTKVSPNPGQMSTLPSEVKTQNITTSKRSSSAIHPNIYPGFILMCLMLIFKSQ